MAMDEKETKAYLNLVKNANYQKGQFLIQIYAACNDSKDSPEDRIERVKQLVKLSGVYLEDR